MTAGIAQLLFVFDCGCGFGAAWAAGLLTVGFVTEGLLTEGIGSVTLTLPPADA